MLLKPMDTWGAMGPSPNSFLKRRTISCVISLTPGL